MNYVGIDIGSTASKVAVIGEKEFFFVLPTGWSSKETCQTIEEKLKEKGVDVRSENTKVVATGYGRMVQDFLMNDKCSAGTGKFLEIMANRLGVTLQELFDMAEAGTVLPISSLCTVFAESEVINYIGEGRKRGDIAAGVVDSVATKVAQLSQRKTFSEKAILTGGLSDSNYFCKILSEKVNHKVETTENGRYAGALGAALLAREKSR